MSATAARPRELRWQYAAGLLFGDWGTSRLYVLGLAFAMSGYSAWWYVAAMCLLVTLVGLCYTVICRHFPEGGGVYSAARARSPYLAVVGAWLIFADYTVTAALSAYEGFRYILPNGVDPRWALYSALGALALIAALNFFGLRRPGGAALVIALAAGAMYLALAAFCVPHLRGAVVAPPHATFSEGWGHFANVILALSGVETIANMTGVMAEPVARNARRAILVVMIEVVALNLVMSWAVGAVPALDAYSPEDRRDHMVKILAEAYVGPAFAAVSGVVFGALLLSAANTAVNGMVSVQYMMARDEELPPAFARLNSAGVPWMPLVAGTALTAAVLLIVGEHTETLASLYAIGVVGAITINLLSTGSNQDLALTRSERVLLIAVGLVTLAVEITIAYDKPQALFFAVLVIGAGLALRALPGFARELGRAFPGRAPPAVASPAPAAPSPRIHVPPGVPRLLVCVRGDTKVTAFAASYASERQAVLFVLYVREVRVAFRERLAWREPPQAAVSAYDAQARALFAAAGRQCAELNVQMVPLYAVHDSPAEIVLDHAATLGVEALIMGASRRGQLYRILRGDVLQEVIQHLPENIPLLIYA